MIIQCPECSARFRIPGDKVQVGAKVRCSRCKHVFRVAEPAPAEAPEEAPALRPNRPTTQDPFGLGDIYQEPAAPRLRAPSAPSLLADRTTGLPGAPLEAEDPFARQDPFAATRFGQSQAPDPDPFSQPDPFAPTSFARHVGESPSDASDAAGVAFPSFEGDPAPVDSHYQFGAPDPDDFMREAVSFKEEPHPSEDRFSVDEGVFERFGESPRAAPEGAFGGFWGADEADDAQAPPLDSPQEPEGGFWTQEELGAAADPAPAGGWFGGDALDDPPAAPRAEPARPRAEPPRAEPPRAAVVSGAAARLPRRRAEPAKAPEPAKARTPEPERPAEPPSPPPRDDPPPSQRSPSGGLVIAPAALRAESEGASPLQTVVNLFLILVLVVVGFLGFVAWSNDGLLDFKALGDMTAAAFGQGRYTPRGAAPDAPDAPDAEAPTPQAPLVIEDQEALFFPNKDGARLLVVEGRVVNRGPAPAAGITLLGKRAGDDAAHEAPAGRPLSEEELLDITDEGARAAAYQKVKAEAEDMTLQPGQAARFSLVFFPAEGAGDARPEVTVEAKASVP